MLNLPRRLRGGNSLHTEAESYHIPFYTFNNPNTLNRNKGFRCVYPINSHPIKNYHVQHGESWGTFNTVYLPSDSYRLDLTIDWAYDLGFRCVYLGKSDA